MSEQGESSQGYPEAQPEEVASDQGGATQNRKDKKGDGEAAASNDDGTATGNPTAAG